VDRGHGLLRRLQGRADRPQRHNGHAYASGTLVGTNYLCFGWLERSYLGGAFTRVSAVHSDDDAISSSTNWYWDAAGYRARMCVEPAYRDAPAWCTAAW
jgi:hypothetical protein